ncbi:MAG: formylmethanofuran dehydrogenase subunit A [Gammaproteobacteria bacterium RBG_16_51_14]|nr:MAG: formylmethanofuran dehydrogenase subunit A [Gammaproteobacteria bacterium RBG_16_51_14]
MMIKLSGGKMYDPIHGINGEQRNIYIRDGFITTKPATSVRIDRNYDLNDMIIMAGAIDIHTHIGGGKVNIARMMLPEDHRGDPVARTAITRSGSGYTAPSTFATGYRYAEMGYTTCIEPAMLPANARHAHMEMADIPIIDKGAYALLGNDDFFLRMLASGKDRSLICDYVSWIINATKAIGIKVVNPGGISAFKFNQRKLDLDETNSHYGVTPRQILITLARAVRELGIPHPLHVHGCNLGVPGNLLTTLDTIRAAEGLPMHLAHIQFHSYGTEGDRKFSSGSAHIAEAVNANSNISIDVGQILFGQTVTASGDTMLQYAGHRHAHPNKWVIMDIECDAGCGVVPFKYRDKSFVNALQWTIGLELFLLVNDPWRIFLTTDHPNGAPFTSYPHLIRLLMDRSFRNDMLSTIHKQAAAVSILGSLDREYSLYEIAIMTRAAPARSLGLQNRGHLGAGAAADITVYKNLKNREAMFAKPVYVFKDGELVARNGKIIKVINGSTHILKPEYDKGIEKTLKNYFDKYHTMKLDHFKINDDEIVAHGNGNIIVQSCM